MVAVIRGNRLVVANAGDSRCIMSRNGKVHPCPFIECLLCTGVYMYITQILWASQCPSEIFSMQSRVPSCFIDILWWVFHLILFQCPFKCLDMV